MGIYLTTTMAAREAALDDPKDDHTFWRLPYTIENFIDTMENLLEGPVSAQTSRALDPASTDQSAALPRRNPRSRAPRST